MPAYGNICRTIFISLFVSHAVSGASTSDDGLSPLNQTTNYLPLIRTNNAGASLLPARSSGAPYTPLHTFKSQGQTAVEIEVEGQKFAVVLDTGTSDTWVLKKGFNCTDVNSEGQPEPKGSCMLGTEFVGGFPEGPIPGENFSPAYGGGEILFGNRGYLDVTVAGICVNQSVGLVTSGWWDIGSSGVLGLAYPSVTYNFVGTNASLDNWYVQGNQPGDEKQYPPIVTTMIAQNLLQAPLFSIAIERPNKGFVAFGGLPPVQFDHVFAQTPIIKSDLGGLYPTRFNNQYALYTIAPDGYVVRNGTSSTSPTTLIADTTPGFVDSGSPGLFLPSDAYNAFISSWSVPPVANNGSLYAPCNSTAPPLGVKIGGMVFNVSSKDVIYEGGGGYLNTTTGVEMCPVNVADGAGPGGLTIVVFGETFLSNVVAVFDVGASKMRFAQHNY